MSSHNRILKYFPVLSGITVVVVIGGMLIYFVSNMLKDEPAQQKKMVQQISLVVPPPPPPPPPKLEKPPDPQIEEVKIEEPEMPEEMPDTPEELPPAGEMLGLDAEGGAGGDAFGLIGKKGGRSLLDGTSGSAFAWYSKKLQSHIQDKLYELTEKDEFKKIRKGGYAIQVKVWIDEDLGLRAQLDGTSGDSRRDQVLSKALVQLGRIDVRAPDEMRQPIRLRIVSRI